MTEVKLCSRGDGGEGGDGGGGGWRWGSKEGATALCKEAPGLDGLVRVRVGSDYVLVCAAACIFGVALCVSPLKIWVNV